MRLRGELSGVKRAASGHLYWRLKDDNAVIDGVMWRGNAARLAFVPEDGIEVVATGKLTTYPGRSNYQIVIERMELAGEGALLALLEKTAPRLAAEGLFDRRAQAPAALSAAHDRRGDLADRRGDPRHPPPAGRSLPEPRAGLAGAGAGPGRGGAGRGGGARLFRAPRGWPGPAPRPRDRRARRRLDRGPVGLQRGGGGARHRRLRRSR